MWLIQFTMPELTTSSVSLIMMPHIQLLSLTDEKVGPETSSIEAGVAAEFSIALSASARAASHFWQTKLMRARRP